MRLRVGLAVLISMIKLSLVLVTLLLSKTVYAGSFAISAEETGDGKQMTWQFTVDSIDGSHVQVACLPEMEPMDDDADQRYCATRGLYWAFEAIEVSDDHDPVEYAYFHNIMGDGNDETGDNLFHFEYAESFSTIFSLEDDHEFDAWVEDDTYTISMTAAIDPSSLDNASAWDDEDDFSNWKCYAAIGSAIADGDDWLDSISILRTDYTELDHDADNSVNELVDGIDSAGPAGNTGLCTPPPCGYESMYPPSCPAGEACSDPPETPKIFIETKPGDSEGTYTIETTIATTYKTATYHCYFDEGKSYQADITQGQSGWKQSASRFGSSSRLYWTEYNSFGRISSSIEFEGTGSQSYTTGSLKFSFTAPYENFHQALDHCPTTEDWVRHVTCYT